MKKRLGEELVRSGLASAEEVEAAAAEASVSHHRLGEVLISRGILEERDIFRALATLYGLSYQSSDELLAVIDPALARTVPQRFQQFYQVLPVAREGDVLLVATTDPLLEVPELGAALGARAVRRVMVTPTDLRRLRMAIELRQTDSSGAVGPALRQADDLLAGDPGATESAQQLLDVLLLDAVAERASDIHIETYRGMTRGCASAWTATCATSPTISSPTCSASGSST
jgi:type IV pilus assembly protein PilB